MDINSNACRICSTEVDEPFKPCKCTSSIHLACLDEWMLNSNRTHCEICRERYNNGQYNRRIWPNRILFILVLLSIYIVSPFIGGIWNKSSVYWWQVDEYCQRYEWWYQIVSSGIYSSHDISQYIILIVYFFVGIFFFVVDMTMFYIYERKMMWIAGTFILNVFCYSVGNLLIAFDRPVIGSEGYDICLKIYKSAPVINLLIWSSGFKIMLLSCSLISLVGIFIAYVIMISIVLITGIYEGIKKYCICVE